MGFSKCNAPFEKKRSSIVSNKNILYFCSTSLCHPARLVSEAEWRCHVCRDAILRVSPPKNAINTNGEEDGVRPRGRTVEQ